MRRAAGLALLLAAACAAPPPSSREADDAMRRADYARALALYRDALARRPGDDLLREKVASARSRLVDRYLETARALVREGDLDRAREVLADAARADPESESVAAARAELAGRRARLTESISRARERLEGGDAAGAHEILAAVAREWPGHPALPALAKRAAGEEAREVIERARAAREKGEPGRALGILGAGLAKLPGDPSLTAADRDLRAAIAARLLESSGRHGLAGRGGSALLLARAAAAVLPGDPRIEGALARARALFRRQHVGRITVAPFADRTGGRGDAAGLARAVSERLAAAPVPFPPRLRVTGSLDRVTVTEEEPATEEAVFEPLLRVERERNPAHRAAERAVRMLEARLGDAERVLADRAEERAELERLGGSARVRGNSGRYYGPYTEALYLRLLGDSRQNEAAARERRDRIRAALDRAKEQLAASPPYLEREVRGHVPYTRTIRRRTALASATLVVGDGAPVPLEASRTVTETVSPGDPAAGLAEDPDEMPDDGAIAALALSDLADRIAAEVARRIPKQREPLLARARELGAAGDAEGALDLYAAYALCVPGGIARATAVRKIRERWGIDLRGGKPRLSELGVE